MKYLNLWINEDGEDFLQGLNELLNEKDEEIKELKARIDKLEAQIIEQYLKQGTVTTTY